MRKTDMILLGVIGLIGLVTYIVLQLSLSGTELKDGTAVVIFKDERILEIELEDGSYTILNQSLGIEVDEDNFLYTIPDTNGTHDLVIEYKDFKVRVKEEVSPQNICSKQQWTNSPLKPLTCLPNSLVILIESATPSDIDGVSG